MDIKPLVRRIVAAWRDWTGYVAPLPEKPLIDAIREAKKADMERNEQRQALHDMRAKLQYLTGLIQDAKPDRAGDYERILERASEISEARQMSGEGPWLIAEARKALESKDPKALGKKLREAQPVGAIGAFGDIELELQNVDWRREINLSWLEFSRWGIQQIILISRLYYIKHPWIRRGVNLSAAYVFGQGFELSSPNPHANDILKDFVKRNKKVLGVVALAKQERAKSLDGNIFWVFFPDKDVTGNVQLRTIDPTEISDIVCDPDDSETPWYYRRSWTARNFNDNDGSITTTQSDAWYPALYYDPPNKKDFINGVKVMWDTPVYHRLCGEVAKWHFGCPRVYPALDWAREGRRFLEAFASVWQALRQIALNIKTKGGQQALEGVKLQMGTTVGPTSPIWDTNPPTVAGGTFASGTGTSIEAFKTTGAGGNASDVKEFRNFVACVLEMPPTWLGDMETSNLSTAQTLDRPTELGFLMKREEWQEDLVVFGTYQLQMAAGAIKGKLREAYGEGAELIEIREANRVYKQTHRGNNHWVYEAAKTPKAAVIEVMATFPAIREGDVSQRVGALVQALTLGTQSIIGIDEKAGLGKVYDEVGIENGPEILEKQYPESTYDPDRTKEPPPTAPPVEPEQPAVAPPAVTVPAVAPNAKVPVPKGQKQPAGASSSTKEAVERLIAAIELMEHSSNGNSR